MATAPAPRLVVSFPRLVGSRAGAFRASSRVAPPRPPLAASSSSSSSSSSPPSPVGGTPSPSASDEHQRRDLAVVLVHPQIPGNTGTIARTCAATRVPLHLVGPLGFELSDARLKRAGLDYWHSVCVRVHEDWDAFARYWRDDLGAPGRLVAFSKFGARPHAEPGAYRAGDWLLFGAETTGLPDEAHDACTASGGVRRIPIDETHVRSLNLAVSVGVGAYEALRQIDGDPEMPPPRTGEVPGTHHASP
jgi:tRNA (cytidine/uridine-2'-O-)-methyltransferase